MTVAINTNRRPPAGLSRTAANLKEPAVRQGFLAGMTIYRLAAAFGVTEDVMRRYVAEHRRSWHAFEHSGIREDERRTVVYARAVRDTGSYDVKPISVPRISMHRAAMEAQI
ncbi:hypothetical protein [Sinorhizobium americanum]|uniref:Uncharacterized protein n=1 Tax=Sinorhizobium americanum TaxID=194963 RepID=A0A4R2BRQ1_9HYPH|nr:hypothetical protein [Sinorhizobium americanum]TCN30301.1 hypothetical protein EV184_108175 [Sinorhizobium americanum]